MLTIHQLVEEIRWLRPVYLACNSLCYAHLCAVLYHVNDTMSVNIA